MISLIVAILTVSILSMPGWIVALRAGAGLGRMVAAGIGSLFFILLVSALLAQLVGGLPAWSVLAFGLAITLAVYGAGRGETIQLPSVRPVQFVFPAFCAAVAFAAYSVAFQTGDDPLVYRAWFNADWFKHLGYVNATANFGLPVSDIFAGRGTLHYYWLFYLLPGAGASLHGDAQGALISINVITVFIFWLLLQEVLKSCGVGDRAAAVLAFIGWSTNTMLGLGILVSSRFDVARLLDELSIDPGMLMEVNSYIPQHVLMLCGLLAFLILFLTPCAMRYRTLLAIAPVVAAGATSTLLGVSVVAICCGAIFLLPRPTLASAVKAGATGLLALALVLVLQVVNPGLDQSTLASPIFDSEQGLRPLSERLSSQAIRTLANLNLALPLGLIGILGGLWAKDRVRFRMATVAGVIFGVGFAAMFAAVLFLDDVRLAGEIALRNKYLMAIGLLMGITLLVASLERGTRAARVIGLALVTLVFLSLPTVVLNFLWLGWSGPDSQLHIPADDMAAMTYLREQTPVDAVVLQYPEPVFFLMEGRDSWVPIFGGRTIAASYRSTTWAVSGPIVARIERFYEGDPVIEPEPGSDWVYLSRALHPQSYDRLVERLQDDPEWIARLELADASLFARAADE
jgi:hypothetical protein